MHAAASGVASLVVADVEPRAARRLAAAARYLPSPTPTRSPPRWPTADPADRATPEAGDIIPGRRPAATTCATSSARSSTTATSSSCAAAGRPTSSPGFATIAGRLGRHRRQPAAGAGRHARHPRVAEGRAVRGDVRRVQPAARHLRRHVGLLPRQGPRVARDDPLRRADGVRLRPRHRASCLRAPCASPTAARTSSWTRSTWATTCAFAWPSAEIAVMGAKGAVEILHRRAAPEERARATSRPTRSGCSTRTSPPNAARSTR